MCSINRLVFSIFLMIPSLTFSQEKFIESKNTTSNGAANPSYIFSQFPELKSAQLLRISEYDGVYIPTTVYKFDPENLGGGNYKTRTLVCEHTVQNGMAGESCMLKRSMAVFDKANHSYVEIGSGVNRSIALAFIKSWNVGSVTSEYPLTINPIGKAIKAENIFKIEKLNKSYKIFYGNCNAEVQIKDVKKSSLIIVIKRPSCTVV